MSPRILWLLIGMALGWFVLPQVKAAFARAAA